MATRAQDREGWREEEEAIDMKKSERLRRKTANRLEDAWVLIFLGLVLPCTGSWLMLSTMDAATREQYPVMWPVINFLFTWGMPPVVLWMFVQFVRSDLKRRNITLGELLTQWFPNPWKAILWTVGIIVFSVVALLFSFLWETINMVFSKWFIPGLLFVALLVGFVISIYRQVKEILARAKQKE